MCWHSQILGKSGQMTPLWRGNDHHTLLIPRECGAASLFDHASISNGLQLLRFTSRRKVGLGTIQPTCLPVRYQEGIGHENCVICWVLYFFQKHICHGTLQQTRELLIPVPIKHAIHSSYPLCKVIHSQSRYTEPGTKWEAQSLLQEMFFRKY